MKQRARTRKQSKEKVKPVVPPLDLYFDKKILKNQRHKIFDEILEGEDKGYNSVLKNELEKEKNYNMMQLFNKPLI